MLRFFALSTHSVLLLFVCLSVEQLSFATDESAEVDKSAEALVRDVRAYWNAENPIDVVSGEIVPKNHLSPALRERIRSFSENHLSDAYKNTKTIFYPFAGADVIFPFLFFPNAKTIILAALEEPGRLPNENFSENSKEVAAAMRNLFDHGYYITKNMGKDFQEKGTSTMIMAGLKLLGFEILDYKHFAFKNGVINMGDKAHNSVVIRCRKQGDEEDRYVYYFDSDLSDGSLSLGFTRFVERFKPYTSFIKAASYVPHYKWASQVNALIRKSAYIIQGDSGLPWRELTKDPSLDIKLFGIYVPPNKNVFEEQEPDLGMAKAYAFALEKHKAPNSRRRFDQLWQLKAPSENELSLAPGQSPPTWGGELSFPYDYAGKITPTSEKYLRLHSNLIYVIRK